LLFTALIDTGSRASVFGGYLFASILMIGAAVVEGRYDVAAEGKSLEDIAGPLGFISCLAKSPKGAPENKRVVEAVVARTLAVRKLVICQLPHIFRPADRT